MSNPEKVKVTDYYGKVSEVEVSKLQWRPSAYGIVIKEGKVLLLKQTNGHDLPGGGIELGETIEQAVIREVKEETGVTVANPRLVEVTSSFYKQFMPEDKYIHSIMIFYACDYVEGELSTAGFDEGEQIYAEAPEWFPIGKLDTIKLGSSNDFRPYIQQIIAENQ